MVMKKVTVIGAIMVMLLLAHWTQAGVSLIRNGSFENDGGISPITTEDTPQYWCDVNIPSDKFNGWVDSDWWTHSYNDGDGNSLILYSKTFGICNEGDMAMVSQQVYLTEDANQIIFDLKLSSSSGGWDPNVRSAVVLIDGNEVWNSENWVPDSNGEYWNQVVDITDVNGVGDGKLHPLSLAIKSNVTETSFPYVEYRVRWDFVKFNAHCGGFGYLPEDLNHDCYVDMLDLKMLAEHWLVKDPNYEYDLFEDGIVNFYDFAFFAEYWTTNSDWENWQDENCYEVELLAGDIDDSGQVDLRDVSIFTSDWLAPVDCGTRADINGDDVVNFQDFAVLAEEWWLKSWLYGL